MSMSQQYINGWKAVMRMLDEQVRQAEAYAKQNRADEFRGILAANKHAQNAVARTLARMQLTGTGGE